MRQTMVRSFKVKLYHPKNHQLEQWRKPKLSKIYRKEDSKAPRIPQMKKIKYRNPYICYHQCACPTNDFIFKKFQRKTQFWALKPFEMIMVGGFRGAGICYHISHPHIFSWNACDCESFSPSTHSATWTWKGKPGEGQASPWDFSWQQNPLQKNPHKNPRFHSMGDDIFTYMNG